MGPQDMEHAKEPRKGLQLQTDQQHLYNIIKGIKKDA
jgi:hypothetical protein